MPQGFSICIPPPFQGGLVRDHPGVNPGGWVDSITRQPTDHNCIPQPTPASQAPAPGGRAVAALPTASAGARTASRSRCSHTSRLAPAARWALGRPSARRNESWESRSPQIPSNPPITPRKMRPPLLGRLGNNPTIKPPSQPPGERVKKTPEELLDF